jgi:hypothetical protein
MTTTPPGPPVPELPPLPPKPSGDPARKGPNGGKLFQKGMSANPGGRPKGIKEIRELAQQFVPRAIYTIVRLMDDENVKESVRLAAAIELMNRGYGRPEQAISISHERKPVDLMTTEDIQRLLQESRMSRQTDTIEGEVIDVTEKGNDETGTPEPSGEEDQTGS